jgi:transcriptional regulator with XRE-family HTH domain
MVATVTTSYARAMTTIAETLGANLRRLRGKMTQEQFEEKTGISQARLSELERGKGWAQVQNLGERLAAAGFDPGALIAPPSFDMDATTREACELFTRAPPTVRHALLLILREHAAAAAGRPASEG